MRSPLVSIVIPVYNGEKYISKSIESILNQDYKNIELIIVNDGSTDKTKEIINSYTNKSKIIHQTNSGQSNALNNGWNISQGDILGYLSCDDELNENCISTCLTYFKNNDIVVVYPNYNLIDEYDNILNEINLGPFSKKKLIEDLVCFPGPGALFRKSIYSEIGGWDDSLTQVPDFEDWLRTAEKGNFIRVNKTLASFRKHDDSGSFKSINIKKSNEIIEVVKKFSKKFKTQGYSEKKALSSAYIISSYHHIKSKRILIVIFYLFKSLIYDASFKNLKKISLNIINFIKSFIYRN